MAGRSGGPGRGRAGLLGGRRDDPRAAATTLKDVRALSVHFTGNAGSSSVRQKPAGGGPQVDRLGRWARRRLTDLDLAHCDTPVLMSGLGGDGMGWRVGGVA